MATKHYVAAVLATLLVCFFTAKMYISNGISSVVFQTRYVDDRPGDRLDVSEYIRQRNNVSRLLNQKQKLIGQMECEVMHVK